MARGVKWCFTLNNYTEAEELHIRQIECAYMIIGHERGAQGTPHLQGFIHFGENNRKTFKSVLRMLNIENQSRVHLERANGTIQQNVDYCSKEGNFWTKGIQPEEPNNKGGNANKRKWEDALEAARQGRFDDIPADLWIRYRKAFKSEYEDTINKGQKEIRDFDIKSHFYWIYGPSGTGKSHLARSLAKTLDPEHKPYLKGLNKWWTGYQMQKVVIIEEATPKACEYLASYFKNWCDKWEFTAETKGGQFVEGIRPEYVIITSNYSIEQCFPNEEDYKAMKRKCMEFEKKTREAWIEPPHQDDEATQQLPPSEMDEPLSLPREDAEILIDEGTIGELQFSPELEEDRIRIEHLRQSWEQCKRDATKFNLDGGGERS